MATYPCGIASWTNRIDNVNTVWAADPNTLAGEIIAVETALGPNPHIESKPITGNPVTFASASERISQTNLGNGRPYALLDSGSFNVRYGSALDGYGMYNVYSKISDYGGFFNGSDITAPATGLYMIYVQQTWQYYTSGYLSLALAIDGAYQAGDMWHWTFPSGSASNYSANYANRYAHTNFSWMGSLEKGQRVRIVSENGTSKNPYPVIGGTVRIHYLRQTLG